MNERGEAGWPTQLNVRNNLTVRIQHVLVAAAVTLEYTWTQITLLYLRPLRPAWSPLTFGHSTGNSRKLVLHLIISPNVGE